MTSFKRKMPPSPCFSVACWPWLVATPALAGECPADKAGANALATRPRRRLA